MDGRMIEPHNCCLLPSETNSSCFDSQRVATLWVAGNVHKSSSSELQCMPGDRATSPQIIYSSSSSIPNLLQGPHTGYEREQLPMSQHAQNCLPTRLSACRSLPYNQLLWTCAHAHPAFWQALDSSSAGLPAQCQLIACRSLTLEAAASSRSVCTHTSRAASTAALRSSWACRTRWPSTCGAWAASWQSC